MVPTSGGDRRQDRVREPDQDRWQRLGLAARAELPRGLQVDRAIRAGHRADDGRPQLLHVLRDQPPRAVLRLAGGLQQVGIRRGIRRIQLRPLQLADLRVRAEAERVAVAFARCEWPAGRDAAAWPVDADPETNKEALSKARIRP